MYASQFYAKRHANQQEPSPSYKMHVISDRNVSKAVDWLMMSQVSDMVNDILVYGSQKHNGRNPLIGQTLEVKGLFVLHN